MKILARYSNSADRRQTTSRSCRGSALILTLAIFGGFFLAFMFFGLKYTRILGSHQEQKTAIEAAAIAAASDLSRIVYEDKYFGFVSLSDCPPISNSPFTAAGDGYAMPVQGINTLLATIRLDMIIADAINDPRLQFLCARDYGLAVNVANELNTELANDITSAGSGKDANGAIVTPYLDAIAAYQSNCIRMAGGTTTLVPNSLNLSLGCVAGVTTNTPIPQPPSCGQVSSAQQANNCYLAYTDIPYVSTAPSAPTYHFVFAGTSDQTKIVDTNQFLSTIAGLPPFPAIPAVPSIIQCAADENFVDQQNGKQVNLTVHAIACAEPICTIDTRPHPGLLTFSFLSGLIPQFSQPGNIFTDQQLSSSGADYVQSPNTSSAPFDFPENSSPADITLTTSTLVPQGYFPTTTVSPGFSPVATQPFISQLMAVAFYDWLRCAGDNPNALAVMDMLNTPFNSSLSAGTGQIHMYEVQPSGSISYSVLQIPAPAASNVSMRVSNMQWAANAGAGLDFVVQQNPPYQASVYSTYDVLIRDAVYQPGRIQGGIHGGQPLGSQLPAGTPGTLPPISQLINGPTAWAGSPGTGLNPPIPNNFPYPPGSGPRPTYRQDGVAVDFYFRQMP